MHCNSIKESLYVVFDNTVGAKSIAFIICKACINRMCPQHATKQSYEAFAKLSERPSY